MTTLLLVVLIAFDVVLLVCFYWTNKRQRVSHDLLRELSEERRLLNELRTNVNEELESAQGKSREALDRVSRIAVEAEHEVKSGIATMTKELTNIADEMTQKFEAPLVALSQKQSYVESAIKRLETEKEVLQRLLARGEKIVRFFDKRVPYEDVISEIEDKKYTDARFLLAKGQKPAAVARELGMSESEVRIVAGLVESSAP